MKRSLLVVSTIALSAAAAGAARAQLPMGRPVHVGVSGGVTVPLTDAVKSTQGDLAAESKLGYNLNGLLEFSVPVFPVGLRAEFIYHNVEGKELSFSDPILGSFSGQVDTRVIGGTLDALFTGGGIVAKPYVIAGVGVYNTQLTGKYTSTGFGSATEKDKSTDFGLNGGLGLRFPLGGMSTFVEARYHYIFNKKDCTNSTADVCFDRDNTAFVPISFGVMF